MNKQSDNAFQRKLIENQEQITSIPDDLLNDLQDVLTKDTASGKTLTEIIEDIQGRFDVSESKARLIARTETAKINAALTQARSEALGISCYEWLSALKDTTRESHAEMHEQIVDYDNPPTLDEPEGEYHAGEAPNCFCWQNPCVLDEQADPTVESDVRDDETTRGEDGSIGDSAIEFLEGNTEE